MIVLGCGSDNPVPDAPPPPPTSPDERGYDAISYKLVGAFDWSTKQLTAHETIELDVAAGQHAIELDTTVEIERIASLAGAALPYDHDRGAGRLTVDVSQLTTAAGAVSFTVDYRASASGTLIASVGRDDDPVRSRVVFTNSEPDLAGTWLVAHVHPSDRAKFSAELTVDADEDVIGNGARVRDDVVGDKRVIGYALDQPIPTYLMAFAAGELDHVDRPGPTPLSIWHRRGLLIDAKANLDVVADLMARFAAKIGPYPWPSYSVVLVPSPFGGGMENATITFNQETSGQGNISRSLHAHELGHQWFGDWVTMNDYHDAWFKEGMATLLAVEADRGLRDPGGLDRKFGSSFVFSPDDAIVDHSLSGLARYTSGPYERAAWMMTQIRTKIGDDAFWAALRAMLADNALGTLSGERYLQGFAPALGAAEIAQLTGTLERKPTPAVSFAVSATGAGDADHEVTISLTDSEHQLLVPFEVTVVDAAGAATTHEVRPGQATTVVVPAGGYLAPDEDDQNPPWDFPFQTDRDAYFGSLAQLFVPFSPPAVTAFVNRSAAHQELAINYVGLPLPQADAFPAFYAALDSTFARRSAEIVLCRIIEFSPPDAAATWIAQIPVFFAMPAIESFSPNFGRCGIAAANALAELTQLVDHITPGTARRLSFLLGFDYGAEVSIAQIGRVVRTAPSLLLREQALNRLATQAEQNGYSPIVDAAPWNALFEEQLALAVSTTRFNLAWRGARALTDRAALPIVAGRLHIYTLTEPRQRQVVCDAFNMTGGDAAWQSFRDAAQPWTRLSAAAQAVLADPASCNTALQRSQREPVLAKPR